MACPARKVLVALVSSLFAAPLAFGNPVGPAVVNGTVGFATAGKTLTVTNTPSAIINWQGFSIGTGETTRFAQQSAASAVLNRVVGQDPSAILGTLSSNGRVFLLNPNGIVFGQGSVVNVAGLVASTLNLSNQDFLAGRLNFEAGAVANPILNHGNIATPSGGRVYLIAPNVENHGVISTPQGQTILAAGKTVQLVEADVPNLRVEIQAGGEALNVGQIIADGGAAGIYAGLINQRGIVRADSASRDTAGNIVFRASDKVILDSGSVTSASSGSIAINADVVIHTGTVDVSGASGGSIVMQARNVLSAGRLNADGTAGAGGSVSVEASGRILQTAAAHVSADSVGGDGGAVTLQAQERVFGSGSLSATGSGKGGEIKVLAGEIVLLGAAIDASGNAGGGTILVGGDFQGRNPAVPNAAATNINFSTTLKADALASGNGGKVIVWSDQETQFYGSISARGGSQSGDGGFIEVSGKENLIMGGFADAGAPNGTPGTLLLDPKNIIIDSAGGGGGVTAIPLVDPNPGTGGDQFAQAVTVLSNNNIVATDPNDDFAAGNAGAVYLFNGTTGALISALTGSATGRFVGNGGVIALSNGNYVVRTPLWSNGAVVSAGAVTFGSGTTGVSGVVSAANSLVGSIANDNVGGGSGGGVTALPNGNYVVISPQKFVGVNSNAGAVTFGSGTTGVSGGIFSANSLVGSSTNDFVGSGGITVLSNGNYVVRTASWRNVAVGAGQAGAVTFGNGATGISGFVSATNSLVGTTTLDRVGFNGVTALTNGNYVVKSATWNNVGAATFGNGTTGISGVVSALNSLVGTTAIDNVGGAVTALSNGNYVVVSTAWNNGVVPDVGAVTFGNGTTGISGPVSTLNSLVGTLGGDQVGFGGVTALANGNYVVRSTIWNNAGVTQAGAVTFGSGTSGVSGTVSAANSLVGTTTADRVGIDGVTALANSNYVVRSTIWNNGVPGMQVGAVTFGSGTTGISGPVSAANSLVGTSLFDLVGSDGVTALSNGNYVVSSPNWEGTTVNVGAVTWVDGSNGRPFGAASPGAVVSAANSLVGSSFNDNVGSGGVTALTNGNYVVRTAGWRGADSNVGAVTWVDGSNGRPLGAASPGEVVSAANSLVGSTLDDVIGSGGVTALTNGNYVVSSQVWDGADTNVGAVTWGNGLGGTVGAVSAANSLVGLTQNDIVGANGVTALSNGNYVLISVVWDNAGVIDAGAVTFGNGTTGITGPVSAANSLVGGTAGDGNGGIGIASLPNGKFVATITRADNGALVDAGLVYLVTPPGSFSNPLAFASSPSSTATITPAAITAITNTGTAVVLQANNDITLAAASDIVTSAAGAGGALTMQAGRSVLLNSNITTDNGNLTIKANEQLASGVVDAQRDPGAAVITMAPGTTINAGSGTVTIALRDGAGLTYGQGGAITLGNLSGANVTLQNDTAGGAGGIGILGTLSAGALTATTNGGNFNVTGATTISSAATVTVGAGNASFTTVEGPGSLAVNSSGVETFGAVGTVTPLASITTDAPGTVSLGGNVTTTGAQSFNDALTAGAVTLTSTGGGAILVNNASFSFPSSISTTGVVTFAGTLVGTSGAPLALLVTPAELVFTQVATAFLSAPSIPAAITAPTGSSITINGVLFVASTASIAASGIPAACTGLVDPTTGACTPAPEIPPPPPQVLPPAPPQPSAPPRDTGDETAADAGTSATGEGPDGTQTRRRRVPRCG